jgi:hypothetical protein
MAKMRIKSLDQRLYSALCVRNLASTSQKIGETMKTGMSRDDRNSELLMYFSSKILFMRGFIMDGNFQAEHMKMRNPENDVPLSEGTGFMVSRIPYELHLQSAFERRQVRLVSCIYVTGAHAGKEVNMS